MNRFTFTEFLTHIRAAYREQPRRFHVLAVRFYLGLETEESLRRYLDENAVYVIIRSR